MERADGEQMVIDELFPKCKSISVDYAIMEQAKEMYVFQADFGWSDLIAEKDNTLLICKLTEEQRIKEFSQMAAR